MLTVRAGSSRQALLGVRRATGVRTLTRVPIRSLAAQRRREGVADATVTTGPRVSPQITSASSGAFDEHVGG